jgi:hypothetical protein
LYISHACVAMGITDVLIFGMLLIRHAVFVRRIVSDASTHCSTGCSRVVFPWIALISLSDSTIMHSCACAFICLHRPSSHVCDTSHYFIFFTFPRACSFSRCRVYSGYCRWHRDMVHDLRIFGVYLIRATCSGHDESCSRRSEHSAYIYPRPYVFAHVSYITFTILFLNKLLDLYMVLLSLNHFSNL